MTTTREEADKIQQGLWDELFSLKSGSALFSLRSSFNIVSMGLQEDTDGFYVRVLHEPAKDKVMAKLPTERDGVRIKYETTDRAKRQSNRI